MNQIGKQTKSFIKKQVVKKLISSLVAYIGLPTILIVSGILLAILIVAAVFVGSSSNSSISYQGNFSNQTLSADTLKHKATVEKMAAKYGISDSVPILLAIIEIETGGRLADVMQSSESLGLPVNTLGANESIEQGVKYFASLQTRADELGINNLLAVLQAYNFGGGYLTYLNKNSKEHSLETADYYSRTVVAPSLGNTTAEHCSYSLAIAVSYNGGYRYCNGGDFFYAEKASQYLITGESSVKTVGNLKGSKVYKTIMKEGLKYEGFTYVLGGSTPSTSFDCSGLTQWVYKKAGVNLPRTAAQQHGATRKISISEAQPGDLIFFKGTGNRPSNYISHVGIYVSPNKMYDSNSKGVGYSDWTNVYWSAYFDSIHRVVK